MNAVQPAARRRPAATRAGPTGVFEATLIAAIAGVAWVATIDVASRCRGRRDDGPWFVASSARWALMMTAMMLTALAPLTASIGHAGGQQSPSSIASW